MFTRLYRKSCLKLQNQVVFSSIGPYIGPYMAILQMSTMEILITRDTKINGLALSENTRREIP